MILDLDRILDFQHLFLWKIEEEILTVYFFKVWIHYPTSLLCFSDFQHTGCHLHYLYE